MKVINRVWLAVVSLYLAYNAFFWATTYRHFVKDVINGPNGVAVFNIEYHDSLVELAFPLLIFFAKRLDRYAYYGVSIVFASWLFLNDLMFVVLQYYGHGAKQGVFPIQNHLSVMFFDISFIVSAGALAGLIWSSKRDDCIRNASSWGTCLALCLSMYIFEVAGRLSLFAKQFLYGASSPWLAKHAEYFFENNVWVAASTTLTVVVACTLLGLTRRSSGRPASEHFGSERPT